MEDTIAGRITDRQKQVLGLIARGRSNGEIAAELGLTVDGVKWHVSEILSRLQVASREEAAEAWRRELSWRRRLSKSLGLISAPVYGAAGGAAIFGVIALAAVAIASTGSDGRPHASADQEYRATPTATTAVVSSVATPTPEPLCPQLNPRADGSWGFREGAPKCPAMNLPEIAAIAGPGCNLDGKRIPTFISGWLQNVTFEGCSMRGADLSHVIANDADFRGVDLTGANLSGGTYAWASFEGAILRDIVANPGVFQNAVFWDADLTGADLSNAIVNAVGWAGATCPDGTLADDRPTRSCIGVPGLENPPMTYASAEPGPTE